MVAMTIADADKRENTGVLAGAIIRTHGKQRKHEVLAAIG